jgi:hypothetical protein
MQVREKFGNNHIHQSGFEILFPTLQKRLQMFKAPNEKFGPSKANNVEIGMSVMNDAVCSLLNITVNS